MENGEVKEEFLEGIWNKLDKKYKRNYFDFLSPKDKGNLKGRTNEEKAKKLFKKNINKSIF